jgi:hypothetical protein
MADDASDEESEKASRPRAGKEKSGALLEVLSKHFNTPVKLRAYGPRVDSKVIVEHKAMMSALYAMQPNLSFVPMVLKSCLVDLATSQQLAWKFAEADIERFATDVGPRIRMMCRHLAQAIGKQKPPGWAVSLVGLVPGDVGDSRTGDLKKPVGEAEPTSAPKHRRILEKSAAEKKDEPDDGPGGAEVSKPPELFYFVGWDSEQESAWRLLPNAKASGKEFTKDLVENDEAEDDDLCIARWKDGYEKELAALTYGQLRISRATHKAVGVRGAAELWSNEGGTLTIRLKTDRKQLIWLREVVDGKGNQICQVAVDNMQSEADALKLMTNIAVGYDSGNIEKSELYSRRDFLMEEYVEQHMTTTGTGGSSSSGPLKRPAAAKAQVKIEPKSIVAEVHGSSELGAAPSTQAPSTPPKKGKVGAKAKAKAAVPAPKVLYKANFEFAASDLDVFSTSLDLD